MEITKDYIRKICDQDTIPLWNTLPDTFPEFLTGISEAEKMKNEAVLNRYLPALRKQFSRFPSEKELQMPWKRKTDALLRDFLGEEKILNVSGTLGDGLYKDFEREAKRFMQRARAFDPALGMDELWQAMRNYFIYAMIIDFQGQSQDCSDPVFAYSLLYPYTDNFIDCPARTKQEKERFNSMILSVLKGELYQPGNEDEEKVCRLLLLIREFYGKEKRELLISVLLLMLDAQKESLGQQKGKKAELEEKLSEDEILCISSYKGGISVLLDYLFHVDVIWPKEVEFYLKFGFILQLSDDLQDIEEDIRAGNRTLMSHAAENGTLEQTVNRLLHFSWQVMSGFSPKNDRLKEFAVKNCLQMILSTTVTCRNYFSAGYLKQVEAYLPWHISYYKNFQAPQQGRASDPKAVRERQMQLLDVMIST